VHAGILLFQHILFLDLLLLQIIFLNADRLETRTVRVFHRRVRAEHLDQNAETASRPICFAAAASMTAVSIGFVLIWVFRVSFYPVSDWHMYSHVDRQGPVFYHKMVATLEDGRSVLVPRRDYAPAKMPGMASTLQRAFMSPWRGRIFDQFLSALVQRRNRELPAGARIATIEVEQWRWNYTVDPNDPRLGWVTRRYFFDATANHPGPTAIR
jgi:hypothetical protein